MHSIEGKRQGKIICYKSVFCSFSIFSIHLRISWSMRGGKNIVFNVLKALLSVQAHQMIRPCMDSAIVKAVPFRDE